MFCVTSEDKESLFLNLEETSFPYNKLVALETTGTK